jgi:hypothetical protein
VAIQDERRVLAARLARAIAASADDVDRAIVLRHESWPTEKRNIVSTLSTVAWIEALLDALDQSRRESFLTEPDKEGKTPLARLLSGDFSVSGDLAELQAGPFDVYWDGNWPDSVARKRLRGRMPAGARLDDVVIGSDGGGTRIKIRVVEDNGVLTGDVLDETWTDPPLEDVWSDTYSRLEALYPEEIPELLRRR